MHFGCVQRPKLGFVATEPGSRLRFTINTRHSAASSIAVPATVVAVSFLRSYDTMGMASALHPPSLQNPGLDISWVSDHVRSIVG